MLFQWLKANSLSLRQLSQVDIHSWYQYILGSTSLFHAHMHNIYRIGGNFRGMKFSWISQMIPALWIYHREHFMYQQCKILDMMPPGENLLEYRLEPIIKQFNTPTLRISVRIHEICPKNIVIALHCHYEHIVSVSLFSYASQGFSWFCIPQMFIYRWYPGTQLSRMNISLSIMACANNNNVRFQLMHVSDYAPDTMQYYQEDIHMWFANV